MYCSVYDDSCFFDVVKSLAQIETWQRDLLGLGESSYLLIKAGYTETKKGPFQKERCMEQTVVAFAAVV